MSGSVHFVLCVDTEGPLYESRGELFKRLGLLFGIDLEPSEENLRLLREGRIDLGGREEAVKKVVSPAVCDRLATWDRVLESVEKGNTPEYRNQLLDDDGKPIIFNWFLCDWVGFEQNPRRKSLGLNVIFSQYWSLFAGEPETNPIYFHHHSVPFSRASHHCCRNWSNSSTHILRLSAALLEYGHFPAAVRSPIQAPDISFFLDQIFPFDLSNTAGDADGQPDVLSRRFSDWLDAYDDWTVYRPDYANYQRPGDMRRAIGRCLQLGSRYGNLTRSDAVRAFEKARGGEAVLLSGHFHDWTHVDRLCPYFAMIDEVRREFPDVAYLNATCVDAFRSVLRLEPREPPRFDMKLDGNVFVCRSDKDLFGPQPWFCFRTKDGHYLWDNMDMFPGRRWQYVFDDETFPLDAVDRIAVAANDSYGNAAARVFDLRDGGLTEILLARPGARPASRVAAGAGRWDGPEPREARAAGGDRE